MQAPFCSVEAEQLSYMGPTDLVKYSNSLTATFSFSSSSSVIIINGFERHYIVNILVQVQYFIRNTSMVVTHIEGSGNGARVYVVNLFFL